MHHIIVGTAGHVDHGKTTLVKALTGQETDRLKEEKERGISIELGFASFTLDSGQKIGLVDVPGHEKFVRHMLAGVAGIDLVLLVIAADEGVMPQTREHLDIINLLHVKKGVVVLTKIDMVDGEWLELIKEDVRGALKDSLLADEPIISVSAKTGQGIDELKRIIAAKVLETPAKEGVGSARLPIDRVFTVTGFGTVITGTLWSGKIAVGDKLNIYPQNIEAKVRTIQVHGGQVETAIAGQRAAINLGNVSLDEISRGNVLAAPDLLEPSIRFDVELKLLASWEHSLKHRQRVRVHIGTNELLGRVYLLDREELAPGESAFAQLILEMEAVALPKDNFVIRSYSPMITIGGGQVIEPVAKKVKRYREDVLEKMMIKLEGSPEEKLLQVIRENGIQEVSQLAKLVEHDVASINNSIKLLDEEKKIIILQSGHYIVAREEYRDLTEQATAILEAYHGQYPLRLGISKEELKSRLAKGINQKTFLALLEYWSTKGLFKSEGDKVAIASHTPVISREAEKLIESIYRLLDSTPFQPPTLKEIANELNTSTNKLEEALQYLQLKGRVYKITEEIYISNDAIDKLKQIITELYQSKKEIQLGEV
ncbi:MAG: selenocysteine-specific translation elongation factor, partial [Bacillota bacterium]|nr:selenocysteine-specific translation elongation factor [Bacillota bacterium]